MSHARLRHGALAALLLAGPVAAGARAEPQLPTEDVVRLSEFRRLAETLQERVWPGWENAPFSLVLVTGEREFLIGAEQAPPRFARTEDPPRPWGDTWWRPRTFETALLATFPAFGPAPTIVVGEPSATQRTSTTWVLSVLHEHFHQLQMAWPEYYEATSDLHLGDDERSGNWMLDYPFPYGDPAVGREFASLTRDLAKAVEKPSASRRERFWRHYARFQAGLSDNDASYLRFQVWQEGVARYVELKMAETASREYDPTPEFTALADHVSFAEAATRMRDDVLAQLRRADLAVRRRSSFYPLGASIALLLDVEDPSWKDRYLDGTFRLGGR